MRPDPHLVADIFKICSIPNSLTSDLRERFSASKPAWIKSSVNLSYLVVFLYKIVRGLSAQPEVFLLASLARRLTPGPAFAQ